MITFETRTDSNRALITFPIFALLIYIVFTFLPVIYSYLAFFGKIRIVLLAGIALVISYFRTAGNYRNAGAYRNPVLFAWLAFFGVLVVGLIVSYDRGLTLKIIETNFKYFIVFLVIIKVIDSVKRLDLVLGIFAACGVGMALSTILNYFVLGVTFEESYRAMALEAGIFGDPNDLAMLFNVTLPILLYFLTKRRRKLLLLPGIAVVIMAIMLTYSRGGFIGLCAVGVGFLLLMGKRRARYFLLVLVSGILFWTLAPESYKERISTIKEEAQIDQETGKYPGRMEAWKTVIGEGMKSPFLGAGAGCSYYVSGSAMRDWHVTHNSFVQVFAEMGILGLCPFVMLFVMPYKKYRSFKRESIVGLEAHLERYRFVLLSLVAFGTTAFFLPQAYSPILYFMTGLALVQAELASRCKANSELRRPKEI